MRYKRQNVFTSYLFLLVFNLSTVYSHELPIKYVDLGYNSGNIIDRNIKDIPYGPITIKPNSFYYKNNIFLIKAINHYNKIIYLALDCNRFKLNISGSSLIWKNWAAPVESFEKHLLEDHCSLSR